MDDTESIVAVILFPGGLALVWFALIASVYRLGKPTTARDMMGLGLWMLGADALARVWFALVATPYVYAVYVVAFFYCLGLWFITCGLGAFAQRLARSTRV